MAERDGGHAGHADHDPFVVAALLDPDLAPVERQAAETLVATCRHCASLHADLMALSSATTDLSTPARPRDFRLTAEDAARLTAASPGEPVATTPRLAGVTTDRTTPTSQHGHDPMLVASLSDRSLGAAERAAAEALVATCGPCADLHADLLALRDATRAMPTPARPRDYALTPEDAARLRRGGWRRLVAAFGSSRDAFSRPLAVGLTTLGIAGLLLATIPSMSLGGAASGSATTAGDRAGGVPQPEVGTDSNGAPVAAASQDVTGGGAQVPVAAAPSAAAAPAATAAPAAVASAPAATAPPKEAFGPVQSAGDAAAPPSVSDFGIKGGDKAAPGGGQPLAGDGTAAGSSVPLLLVVSSLFLVAGIALFAIRWSARRLGDG